MPKRWREGTMGRSLASWEGGCSTNHIPTNPTHPPPSPAHSKDNDQEGAPWSGELGWLCSKSDVTCSASPKHGWLMGRMWCTHRHPIFSRQVKTNLYSKVSEKVLPHGQIFRLWENINTLGQLSPSVFTYLWHNEFEMFFFSSLNCILILALGLVVNSCSHDSYLALCHNFLKVQSVKSCIRGHSGVISRILSCF